jgi:DNA polymerase I-like protein with 3'-5' exonuclease and polymerase domains
VGQELRQVFRADPGFVFIEADQSQAEARVVAVCADDMDMLRMFDELDIHKLTASWVFECTEAGVGNKERNIGKMTRHAGNYNAGKKELMRRIETLAQKFKLGIRISEWRAGKCLDIFHKKSPKIRGIFHEQIRQALVESMVLTNPFGRTRTFYGRFDEDLFKEAYAQIPQSTVSDQTKKAMLECKDLRPDLPILLEGHDAFLCQVRIGEEKDTIKMIQKALERPIDFRNCTLSRNIDLVIPCEVQIGDNWGEMTKYKTD